LTDTQKPPVKRKTKKAAAPDLPSRDAVLQFIRSSPAKVGKREIARAFNLKGDSRIFLKQLLRELADDGLIAKTGKRLRGRGELPSVTVLEIAGNDDNGELYAVPLDWDEAADGARPRILMRLKRGHPPGAGDHVLSRTTKGVK
jgi:ribonuclease R